MESEKIRQAFINFFESKKHQYVKSAPMVVKDDPTLMFTNAGMNQFKDLFLGNRKEAYTKAANTQKCLRVSGKHNDLEEVGLDTYHHTMFEMLGNWSFGDYFKKEAIDWAWELLTKVYKLDKNRLYVTVFGGDTADNLERDDEAAQFWEQYLGKDRILDGSKKDNFWEMGEVGPCGPCSEIHIDIRPDTERTKIDGSKLVNKDHPLVIEVWNLVFIQFNRTANGSLAQLPAKHVDTGMGFERLCMVIQNVKSNYDTDVFQPLIKHLEKKSGKQYISSADFNNSLIDQDSIAMRVVADHIRAITFAIADGQLPSNVKAGYVVRRILRRAVRYGFTFLGLKKPFMFELVSILAGQFQSVFPELSAQKSFIAKVVKEEETAFLKTLEIGLKKMDDLILQAKKTNVNIINGDTVFELYDTFGFPFDLTSLIAREQGLSVDEKRFELAMSKQKERSRSAAIIETGDWTIIGTEGATTFKGYDELSGETKIVKYRTVNTKNQKSYQLVLEETPFYAESGGQVGDQGYLEIDGEKISVLDTKKENDLIIHFVKSLPKSPNSKVKTFVSEKKRKLTCSNHSATHLLHAALREVLGDHVQQKGSLVNEKYLRFDFSHFAKLSEEEIEKIEQIVNDRIRQNIELDEKRNVPIETAKEMGAMALFGEKYGDTVRVITYDSDFSVELCGGTHVNATGEIGIFKILSEASVASGVRRIEALTNQAAIDYFNKQLETLKSVNELLKNPKDVIKSVTQLLEEKKKLILANEKMIKAEQATLTKSLLAKGTMQGEAFVIVEKVSVPNAAVLKDMAFSIGQQKEKAVIILAADIQGKPQILVMFDKYWVENKKVNAGDLVRDWAKVIRGGGGGQPFFATAGGKDVNGLKEVVKVATEWMRTVF